MACEFFNGGGTARCEASSMVTLNFPVYAALARMVRDSSTFPGVIKLPIFGESNNANQW